MKDLQAIYAMIREPYETDEKKNIIDYNWHVDGILKNSQSYNKLSFEKRLENSTAKIIDLNLDMIPILED